MIIRPVLFISLLCSFLGLSAQSVSHVYKTGDLLQRISRPDTLYVINFWATWCKPCIEELPAFDSLNTATRNTAIKIILVSLDFKEDLDKKIRPFLNKNKVKTECVLLDEINGNDFVDKISPKWSGAIPATFFKLGKANELLEKKLRLSELQEQIRKMK